MKRWMVATVALFALSATGVRADELADKYEDNVEKALQWIAKQQKRDGHWGANGDQYPVSMTALAGLALLMEGSTVNQGKYSKNVRAAVDWLTARCQRGGIRDGLIGNPDNPSEARRYMYGHGFGLLFLASAYGEERDRERRAKMKDILTRAVTYCANAQSSRGGWYYTSRAEGGDNDEGSVTITQVQGLRAARNAGIPVQKEIIKKAYGYLKMCTSPNGAVYYSFRSRSERPAITAAAIACLFNAGEYDDPLCKKWFKYCKRTIPIDGGRGVGPRIGHDEYTHFYFSQSVYILGEEGWEKLYGENAKDGLSWSNYRQAYFKHLVSTQANNGSWSGGAGFSVGPIYSTAINCFILQLDRGALPIVQR